MEQSEFKILAAGVAFLLFLTRHIILSSLPPGGPYHIRVPVILAYSNQCLVLRRMLSCKAGIVVGCSIGCSDAQ